VREYCAENTPENLLALVMFGLIFGGFSTIVGTIWKAGNALKALFEIRPKEE
jgi:hypothetical protein